MDERSVDAMTRSSAQQPIVHKTELRREDYQQVDHQTVLSDMALPGFRFHPTEEELVGYYLRRMVEGRRNSVELIASLDLYQHDPWELPAMALMGEKEWFFFCPRDKKYPNGARPNRVTSSGYWKATGTDRAVRCNADFRSCVGLKKTLVFYTGRAPRGNKTDWIMNEYRLPKLLDKSDSAIFGSNPCRWRNSMWSASDHGNCILENDVALCRIYRKSNSATGLAVGATSFHLQSALPALTGSNNSSPRPHDQHQVRQQQVTLPLRLDDSRQGSGVSATFSRGVCDQPSQRLVPLETTIARIIQDSSASRVQASSSSLTSTVSGCYPALPCSSHPCPQQPQSTAVATNSDNVRSSHALMAKLLMEETCYSSRRVNAAVEEHGNINQQVQAERQRRKSECGDLQFTSQMGRMVVGTHIADQDDLTFRARG